MKLTKSDYRELLTALENQAFSDLTLSAKVLKHWTDIMMLERKVKEQEAFLLHSKTTRTVKRRHHFLAMLSTFKNMAKLVLIQKQANHLENKQLKETITLAQIQNDIDNLLI